MKHLDLFGRLARVIALERALDRLRLFFDLKKKEQSRRRTRRRRKQTKGRSSSASSVSFEHLDVLLGLARMAVLDCGLAVLAQPPTFSIDTKEKKKREKREKRRWLSSFSGLCFRGLGFVPMVFALLFDLKQHIKERETLSV